ncbi:MAG: ABC transporter substrate-binding protein [Acidimicrobiia bacterium]
MVSVMLAAVLVIAGCGGDDDDDDAASDDTSETTEASASDTTEASAELTDLGHGVTADTIKLGIAIGDYSTIAQFVDFARGDQQAIAQVFVDDINASGGILGRMVEPVYKTYPLLPGQQPDPLTLCTQWTEDEDVFAVLGVFIDFTGDGQLCVARDHETVHIGHELEQVWIDEAPGGLLLTPDSTKEQQAKVFITLLSEQGMLEGKTVAVVADQDSEGRANDVIAPALEEAGASLGSTAVLTITGEDTSQAQAQMDAFLEQWQGEGVDTIFMAGLTVSAKQFVQKIKEAMPDVQLIFDDDSTSQQGQDLASEGVSPNPYDGSLSTRGRTDTESWDDKTPLLQQCIDTYEAATGETVIGPAELQPDENGKKQQVYIAVADFCGELVMFKAIAEKVGPELTNANWQAAVDDFGAIELVGTNIASLCAGKYAADDEFRLVEWDSSVGASGDWSALTDVQDASGGVCA